MPADETRELPVSLRAAQGTARFYPAREVLFRDGRPEPVEDEGSRCVFSHTVPIGREIISRRLATEQSLLRELESE